MNDLEQRVREAFDEVSLPPEVRARTLAAIDDLVQPREASPSKPPAPRIVKWRRAAIALAACLVLAAVGLVGSRLYFEETAFVGIDVNPSIELGINRFDIVVSAKAYNEDGEALLRDVSVTGKPYDSAVATLTSSDCLRALPGKRRLHCDKRGFQRRRPVRHAAHAKRRLPAQPALRGLLSYG